MRAKPAIPGAVVRYTTPPFRQLPEAGDDVPDDVYWQRRWLAGEVWRLDGDEWTLRLPGGAIRRERADGAATPTGREPLAPMTTR